MYGEMTYKDISATARWHVIDRVSLSTVAVIGFSAELLIGMKKLQSCKEKNIGLTKCSKEC